MAGEVETLEVSPGVEIEVTKFTSEENKKYDRDYSKVTAIFTMKSVNSAKKHVVSDWFDESMEIYRLIGQACKKDIQPNAGVFQGMRATTGFGFRMIRPVDIVPAAQGRTFDAALNALGANTWYGLYHNGAIGAGYNATPLYLRKELGIGWIGLEELNPDPMFDECQLEINGKPLPVFNMLLQMGRVKRPGTVAAFAAAVDSINPIPPSRDFKCFRFPQVEYLKPAIQYRSQVKVNAAGVTGVYGETCMAALGLAFVTSDYLRNTQPTQPSITAP